LLCPSWDTFVRHEFEVSFLHDNKNRSRMKEQLLVSTILLAVAIGSAHATPIDSVLVIAQASQTEQEKPQQRPGSPQQREVQPPPQQRQQREVQPPPPPLRCNRTRRLERRASTALTLLLLRNRQRLRTL
jgi:hypothetical protein